MMNILLGMLITFILQLGIIPTGNKLQKVNSELARKWCHILIGSTMWICCCFLIKNPIIILVYLVGYMIMITFLRKRDLVPDRRHDGKNENDKAALLYALGMFIMALLLLIDRSYVLHFGLATFTLAFGDAFAALIGKTFGKYSPKLIGDKSLVGTLAFIVFGVIGMLIPCIILGYGLTLLPELIFLSVIGCVVELYTGDWDNLLIQVIVGIVALILI